MSDLVAARAELDAVVSLNRTAEMRIADLEDALEAANAENEAAIQYVHGRLRVALEAANKERDHFSHEADRMFAQKVTAEAERDELNERWERDNLCGICPYRKAVQAERDRLAEALWKIADGDTHTARWMQDVARSALAVVAGEPAHQPEHRQPEQQDLGTTAAPSSVVKGVDLIAAERERQMSEEGWTAGHDDEHVGGELAAAACCYATAPEVRAEIMLTDGGAENVNVPGSGYDARHWPWDGGWRPHPDDRVRELVKAGALLAAEIDRLQRLDALTTGHGSAVPPKDSDRSQVGRGGGAET